MDTYTMNRIKSLLRVLSGRTVLRAVLALLLVAACSPLFAQRADVRSAGVYYQDSSQMNVDDDNNVTGIARYIVTGAQALLSLLIIVVLRPSRTHLQMQISKIRG